MGHSTQVSLLSPHASLLLMHVLHLLLALLLLLLLLLSVELHVVGITTVGRLALV